VEVRVNAPRKGKLSVRTRTGYYASAKPAESAPKETRGL
jgi:hypothetical protein